MLGLPKRNLITVSPNEPVIKAINLLKGPPSVGSVVVVQNERLVGLITRRDVLLIPPEDLDTKKGLKVKDVMTRDHLITVPPETSKELIMEILHKNRIEQLIVVDDENRPIDVVAIKDLKRLETICFVLIPFSEPYLTIFNDHIYTLLTRELNLKTVKADDFFKPEPIIESIQFLIKKADVIVADITERNPNVYYEVGFAHALEKKIIFISQSTATIPFDVAHWRCIRYEYTPRGMVEFEKKLKMAVQSVLGDIERVS